MGIRGEIFSTKVSLQNRTYFFNVKENRLGDLYLNIVESKNRDEGGFERQSVILFADDLQQFLQGFDESLKVLEKAVREQRKGKKGGDEKPREKRADKELKSDRENRPENTEDIRPKRAYKRDSEDSFQKREYKRDSEGSFQKHDRPPRQSSREPREGRPERSAGRRSSSGSFHSMDKPRGFKSREGRAKDTGPSRDAPKPRRRVVVKKD